MLDPSSGAAASQDFDPTPPDSPWTALRGLHYALRFLVDNRRKLLGELQRNRCLKDIIEKGSVNTFYQPIAHMNSGEIYGYEALNRPAKTKVFPSTEKFYSFLGHSDLIFEMETLGRQLAIGRFHEHGRPDQRRKKLFINIHPRVMSDPSFRSGKTLELLAQHRLKPEQVILEITEKESVNDYLAFLKVVEHYREQGFRIAVDDAGAGYNSLKTLVHLQPEFIKIDRSLIHGVSENPLQQEMVHLLVSYADRVETRVIAEGIEREEDFDHLRKLGIPFGQGYYICRPAKGLPSVAVGSAL